MTSDQAQATGIEMVGGLNDGWFDLTYTSGAHFRGAAGDDRGVLVPDLATAKRTLRLGQLRQTAGELDALRGRGAGETAGVPQPGRRGGGVLRGVPAAAVEDGQPADELRLEAVDVPSQGDQVVAERSVGEDVWLVVGERRDGGGQQRGRGRRGRQRGDGDHSGSVANIRSPVKQNRVVPGARAMARRR